MSRFQRCPTEEYTDTLISLATDPTIRPAARARQLGLAANRSAWQTEYTPFNHDTTVPKLKFAMTYALLPSLLRAAEGRPHSKQVATETVASMRTHCSKILTSELISYSPHSQDRRERGIRGHISEAAVAAAVLWGMEQGYQSDTTYILPTLFSEDSGDEKAGIPGIDFILRNQGTAAIGLQVKTRLVSNSAVKKAGTYTDKGIPVITPAGLIGESSDFAALELMHGFVHNDGRLLDKANTRFNDQMLAGYRGEHQQALADMLIVRSSEQIAA